MAQNYTEKAQLIEALQWHIDCGADEALLDAPVDRTAPPPLPKREEIAKSAVPNVVGFRDNTPQEASPTPDMMGAAQAIVEAQKLAAESTDLAALQAAIRAFDGLSIRKTATNMVFSDGNPAADVMLIGEAPSADEDVQGKPFVGENGQLLDKILACIGLDRQSDDPTKGVYISNILNWRPPGNRTPSQAEIDISLPFIERHIALAQPKVIILCGGVPAKALLRSNESISRIRGKFHDYTVPPALQGAQNGTIPTIVTYHPAYLLRTPAQKKAVWADMLMVQEWLQNSSP